MADDTRSPSRRLRAGDASVEELAAPPDANEILRALEVLEAVVGDRALLAQLPEGERTRLLVAAGKTVHADLQQKRRLVRSLRGAKKRQAEAHDRSVLRKTGIRAARQADVFVPPTRQLGAGEPASFHEVRKPRTCYVCKDEYRRIHSFYDAMCPPCAELNY